MKTFRLLRADEIECRVSRCSEKGAVLLLYKTARTDADLLDETFGPIAWKNDFKLIDGVLYGGIGIISPIEMHFPDGHSEFHTEWVWKWDAGVESNTEAEKGRASDAFKRAGFKWGLGRELYSAPFVFIPAGKCNVKSQDRGGKTVWQCFDAFDVMGIDYDEQERISYLQIGLKGKTVFEWGEPTNWVSRPTTDKEEPSAMVCEECGRPIRDGKKTDGSPWPAEQVAKYTKLRFGKTLCAECGTVAAAKEKEIRR